MKKIKKKKKKNIGPRLERIRTSNLDLFLIRVELRYIIHIFVVVMPVVSDTLGFLNLIVRISGKCEYPLSGLAITNTLRGLEWKRSFQSFDKRCFFGLSLDIG